MFGFYVNFVLIATFLGMGTGLLRRRDVEALLWIGVPALLTLVGLVAFLAIAPIDVTTEMSEYIWGYVSAADVPRHVSINTAVVALFVVVTLLFIPLGALMGSLVGVGVFAAMSLLRAEPTTWFALAFSVWVALTWRRRPLVFAMAASAVLSLSALHQDMVDFKRAGRFELTRKIRMAYERPYRIIGRIDTVLVVGAGTVNDIAVLLRLGAKYVDAVEIDPVIASIGQIAHPQKPYDDPRVHLFVTDARAFLRAPPRRYDVVTFGTLDSQALLSGMSAVRLDNFVYTLESFRAARSALKPGGSIVLYHLSGYEYIGARLAQLLRRAFDADPRVIKEDDYLLNHTIIAGGGAAGADSTGGSAVLNMPVELSTDDWPFPYLQQRGLPRHYVAALVAVLLVGVCLVGFSAGAAALRAPGLALKSLRIGFRACRRRLTISPSSASW